MSAQHTQERLVLTSQNDYPTGCANFESRSGVDVVVLYHDNAKADARRLVACWNACEGIPTEVLEAQQSGGLPWSVADQIAAAADHNRLCAQRDELQAALREAMKAVEVFHGHIAWEVFRDHSPEMKRWRDAIAKAGGAA